MKKFLCLLTVFTMCLALVACGEQTPSKENSPNEDNAITNQEQSTEGKGETKIIIDEVAEKLGLTDESEVMYDLIGAIAGKQYSGGNVELYQFDENSDAYKDLINGKTYLSPAAYKDGIVLIFAFGVEEDADLVKAFEELEFVK